MTEDEAKQKWCPFARVTAFGTVQVTEGGAEHSVAVVGHGSNRIVCTDPDIEGKIKDAIEAGGWTRCIGSKCMAWRRRETHGAQGHCGLVPS